MEMTPIQVVRIIDRMRLPKSVWCAIRGNRGNHISSKESVWCLNASVDWSPGATVESDQCDGEQLGNYGYKHKLQSWDILSFLRTCLSFEINWSTICRPTNRIIMSYSVFLRMFWHSYINNGPFFEQKLLIDNSYSNLKSFKSFCLF